MLSAPRAPFSFDSLPFADVTIIVVRDSGGRAKAPSERSYNIRINAVIARRNYRIFGACNPPLAHQALTAEDKIGVMLPCNVIVQEIAPSKTEIAAIDPRAAMERVDNPSLVAIANEVAERLTRVVLAI